MINRQMCSNICAIWSNRLRLVYALIVILVVVLKLNSYCDAGWLDAAFGGLQKCWISVSVTSGGCWEHWSVLTLWVLWLWLCIYLVVCGEQRSLLLHIQAQHADVPGRRRMFDVMHVWGNRKVFSVFNLESEKDKKFVCCMSVLVNLSATSVSIRSCTAEPRQWGSKSAWAVGRWEDVSHVRWQKCCACKGQVYTNLRVVSFQMHNTEAEEEIACCVVCGG